MHPDQHTPDSHRYRSADSAPPKSANRHDADHATANHATASHVNEDAADEAPPAAPPELSQQAEAHLHTTSQTVSTPEPEAPRIAEAGNQYVGRQMDDRLKANPRLDDADDALAGNAPEGEEKGGDA